MLAYEFYIISKTMLLLLDEDLMGGRGATFHFIIVPIPYEVLYDYKPPSGFSYFGIRYEVSNVSSYTYRT